MLKEKKRVAFISVLAAVFLTFFKLLIGIVTGSLGILSEALHSALDLLASLITYFTVRISDKPPDRNYNYGHGKFENFSALLETFLLLITCSWIVYEAIQRLVTGKTHIEVNAWSYIVIILAIIIDFTRSRALYKVAKKHNSQALEADALHFSTDIWSSTVVLFGLICSNLGFYFADSIAALMVALFVLLVSYKLGKKAVDVLLDKAPEDMIKKVQQLLRTYHRVVFFHSLKIRTAGADTFIKFNIHMEPHLTLSEVHQICDEIERDLHEIIPRSEIYIHAEPQDNKHLQEEQKENLIF